MIVIVLTVIPEHKQVADAPLVIFGANREGAISEIAGIPGVFESEAERAELIGIVAALKPAVKSGLFRLGTGSRAAKVFVVGGDAPFQGAFFG